MADQTTPPAATLAAYVDNLRYAARWAGDRGINITAGVGVVLSRVRADLIALSAPVPAGTPGDLLAEVATLILLQAHRLACYCTHGCTTECALFARAVAMDLARKVAGVLTAPHEAALARLRTDLAQAATPTDVQVLAVLTTMDWPDDRALPGVELCVGSYWDTATEIAAAVLAVAPTLLPVATNLGATESTGEPVPADAPAELPDYIVIAGGSKGPWIWRCWGDGDCTGWVGLDLSSMDAAHREATRHVAEHHTPGGSAE